MLLVFFSILGCDNLNALRCTDASLCHRGTNAVLGIYPAASIPKGSQINRARSAWKKGGWL
jgi:hypothetical protein